MKCGGIMVPVFMFTFLVIIFALLIGFIAKKRRADTFFWTLMGGLFGPFAIPFVFFAKTRGKSPADSNLTETQTDEAQ